MQRGDQDAGITSGRSRLHQRSRTSTPLGDKSETLAVKKTFGEHAYQLASAPTKSMTGHLLGAAGGVESVIHSARYSPSNATSDNQLSHADPECDLDYVPERSADATVAAALTNRLWVRWNQRARLVFRRFDDISTRSKHAKKVKEIK
jgi:3-oxoacyl-[acyl-carrier-protein] synthase II